MNVPNACQAVASQFILTYEVFTVIVCIQSLKDISIPTVDKKL